MKLPPLPSFAGKKKHTQELFLSLLLYPDAVEAAVWELSKTRQPIIIGAVTQEIVEDSWSARKQAADTCITTLENLSKNTKISKVVLGFPAPYLTREGDIIKDIRHDVKSLTHALGLTPIGFVSIYQAIVHKYKKDEGVPVSIILLGITEGSITMSLYRVGVFVGQVVISRQGSVAEHLEDALLQFSQNTVLPSRILIYGTRRQQLEQIKRDVLKHQWTAKMNFIHFPKVEILAGDGAAIAVSYAGAAELTHSVENMEEEVVEAGESIVESTGGLHTANVDQLEQEFEAQGKEYHGDILNSSAPEDVEENENNSENSLDDEFNDESPDKNSQIDSKEDSEIKGETQEKMDESETDETEDENENEDDLDEEDEVKEHSKQDKINFQEHANVVAVDPRSLGFNTDEEKNELEEEVDKQSFLPTKKHRKRGNPFKALTSVVQRLLLTVKGLSVRKPNQRFKPIYAMVVGILVIGLIGGYYLLDTILPKAQVTVAIVPKTVSLSQSFEVDPSLTEISATAIPGKKREQTETGEKSVPATGKKTIGDPATGVITIYNKSLISRTLKKGTVISAGSVDFTLDTDVSVASASETLDTKTYGKADVKVTAKKIGENGNISAGKTLAISGVSSDIANARNDKAFSGGTSKDVTVVSRSDHDAIVKQLTEELITKAKANFESGESEMLIPETVKTSVTSKVFTKEIGEEATEVSGTITVTISGTAYASSDVSHLLRDKIEAQVEDGYELSSDLPKIETKSPVISKDGTINISASITSTSVPKINSDELVLNLKSLPKEKASEIISSQKGVGGVDITISSLLSKNRMPKRAQAIKIIIKNAP